MQKSEWPGCGSVVLNFRFVDLVSEDSPLSSKRNSLFITFSFFFKWNFNFNPLGYKGIELQTTDNVEVKSF